MAQKLRNGVRVKKMWGRKKMIFSIIGMLIKCLATRNSYLIHSFLFLVCGETACMMSRQKSKFGKSPSAASIL